MELLWDLFFWLIKFLVTGGFSVVFYWCVLGYLHVGIYAYRLGISRSDLWAGDGFGIFFESIPIILLQWAAFYWLLGRLLRKIRRNEK
jgi:hypothetical protein